MGSPGRRVAAAEVPVGHAAAIIRFHDDVARIADPEHLDAIVESMVEASDVLTDRELGRLIAHARATLKPPSERESEEAGLRLGRSFRKVRSCAGFTVFELRLDPEGAAIVEAAIDRLSRPRPDLASDLASDVAPTSRPTSHRTGTRAESSSYRNARREVHEARAPARLQPCERRIRALRPRAGPTRCSRSSAAASPPPRASPAPRAPPWSSRCPSRR